MMMTTMTAMKNVAASKTMMDGRRRTRRLTVSSCSLPTCCSWLLTSKTPRSFSSSSLSSSSWFSTSSSINATNSSSLSSHSRRHSCFRVAIVGSGPSGCYTAKYLLNAATNKNKTTKTVPEEGKTADDDDNNNTNNNSINLDIRVEMFERLPTLYGLVRNGVAPDHPEVKNVQNDFDAQLFSKDDQSGGNNANNTSNSNDTSSSHNTNKINLFANVTVGKDLSLDELREHYDAVVLASGCESDRSLPGIFTTSSSGEEGEDKDESKKSNNNNLLGVLSARQFVNWYNGHPEYDWVGQIVEDVMNMTNKIEDGIGHDSHSDNQMDDTFNVVVIGHGNVALDCARVVAKTMATGATSSLSSSMVQTDIASRALNVLTNSKNSSNRSGTRPHRSRRVVITVVGRRGHIQAAFTIKEIRELTKLVADDGCEFVLDEQDLHDGSKTTASQEELKSSRPRQRIDKLLRDHLKNKTKEQQEEMDGGSGDGDGDGLSSSEVRLRFLMNPIRVESKLDDPTRLGRVICERTELVGNEPGHQKAQGTGEEIEIDADLCLVSIGYRGVPIPGTEPYFDFQKGVINNVHGRVLPLRQEEGNNSGGDDKSLAPLYVSGWLKRGPSGIIGTNIPDAKDTVASILHDLMKKEEEKQAANDDDFEDSFNGKKKDITELLKERNVQIVDWDAYQRIDDYEQSPEHKRHPNQPREKVTSGSKLLEIAASLSSQEI